VRGERKVAYCAMPGILSIGMKIPEMKMSGSRTRLSIDMMSPGLSVGYAAKRVPIVAKQNAVRRTPIISGTTWRTGVEKRRSPAMNGTAAIPRLYRNPLRLSPRMTACRENGARKTGRKIRKYSRPPQLPQSPTSYKTPPSPVPSRGNSPSGRRRPGYFPAQGSPAGTASPWSGSSSRRA